MHKTYNLLIAGDVHGSTPDGQAVVYRPWDIVPTEIENKTMKVTFTEPEHREPPNVQPGRPLLHDFLWLMHRRALRDAGLFLDPDVLESRKNLMKELSELKAEIAEVSDKAADVMHSHEILRLERKHDDLEKRLGATQQALTNVEKHLTLVAERWRSLLQSILELESKLASYGQRPDAVADAALSPLELAERKTDSTILRWAAFERALKNAHLPTERAVRLKEAEASLEAVHEAIKNEEAVTDKRRSHQVNDAGLSL